MRQVPAIAIGKNEGDRFLACLASLEGKTDPIIYVDSGSTDGSVEAARAAGAHVVTLDMSIPFTAARARNAGLAKLAKLDPDGVFVQFLDGDCELQDGWIETGLAALESDPGLAIVCGRRREKFPKATIWNQLIDYEWDTPAGMALACGGDALIRREALEDVGGYDASKIAGEEPEMCFRMRHHPKNWRIARLAAEMTLHDAALHRVGQVWKRAERAGYAYAENAAMHGADPERFKVRETRRAMIWGGLILATPLLFLLFWPLGLLCLLIWPAQVIRLRFLKDYPWDRAVFFTASKLPEAKGVLSFYLHRLSGTKRGLIDYKAKG